MSVLHCPHSADDGSFPQSPGDWIPLGGGGFKYWLLVVKCIVIRMSCEAHVWLHGSSLVSVSCTVLTVTAVTSGTHCRLRHFGKATGLEDIFFCVVFFQCADYFPQAFIVYSDTYLGPNGMRLPWLFQCVRWTDRRSFCFERLRWSWGRTGIQCGHVGSHIPLSLRMSEQVLFFFPFSCTSLALNSYRSSKQWLMLSFKGLALCAH